MVLGRKIDIVDAGSFHKRNLADQLTIGNIQNRETESAAARVSVEPSEWSIFFFFFFFFFFFSHRWTPGQMAGMVWHD